ncbi:MAG: glycosyltransferase family 4 protein [Candidatus Symbiobacter sp.]|nr:glycosyltransferase family 4 protein [Candidatus Symbiobacter sp.]
MRLPTGRTRPLSPNLPSPLRMAYLVSHPIQYQAPLLRLIAQTDPIDLTVFFASDFSLHRHIDKDFAQEISWDVDLVSGYRHIFLPPFLPLRAGESPNFWRPFGGGLFGHLRRGKFDVLWIHGFHRAAHLLAIIYAKLLGIKVMLRDEPSALSSERSWPKAALKRILFWGLSRAVNQFLAIGTANQNYWQALGVPKAKITLLPYAVDNDFFRRQIDGLRPDDIQSLRQKYDIAAPDIVVLFVGKLIPRKRPQDLIASLARYQKNAGASAPSLHVVLAGEGEMRAELTESARQLGIAAHVHITGFQSQAELAVWYATADILALPSERETWGLVVNEAMIGGLALLLSDRVGAAMDLLRPGVNGFSYQMGNVVQLTHRLSEMVKPRQNLTKMGETSRQIIANWDFKADLAGLQTALRKIF